MMTPLPHQPGPTRPLSFLAVHRARARHHAAADGLLPRFGNTDAQQRHSERSRYRIGTPVMPSRRRLWSSGAGALSKRGWRVTAAVLVAATLIAGGLLGGHALDRGLVQLRTHTVHTSLQ